MTNRENLAAAMACREGQYVPTWELELHCYDALSGRRLMLGREFEALSAQQQQAAMHANAEIILSVVNRLGLSMVLAPGRYWHVSPGVLAYYVLPSHAVLPQTAIIRKLAGDDLVLVGNTGGVIGMPGSEQYLEFSYKLFDDPQEIDQQARDTLAAGIENARKLRDVGVDVAQTASDIADNHGPFFSPEQMDRYILPYIDQWATAVHEMGMYAVMHTDGNLMPCLETLAETELDAIQAIDPTAGMDMKMAKDAVKGRLCLCGNVDTGLLVSGTPQQIYEATRKLLETCKAGGGLILGASNAVYYETPAENYLAMNQAWREHGRFGSTR